MTSELKPRVGMFSLLYPNKFSEVEHNDFMREARPRNIEGSASKLICFFEK